MGEMSELEYLESQQAEQPSVGQQAFNTAYSGIQAEQNNLIVFQLEMNDMLERLEHLLGGEVAQDDGTGNIIYVKPTNEDLIVLNQYGTQLVMNFVTHYLNRNTILSNYKPDRIFEILDDLGIELADLFYINYEKMGLNTVEKRSRYPLLCMNILHSLESAYNRAIEGNELDSLRSARIVTQTQPLGNNHGHHPQPKKGFSMNPFKGFRA